MEAVFATLLALIPFLFFCVIVIAIDADRY